MALPGNKNFSDYDNYITDQNPTTSAQAQDYFQNQAELLKAVIDCDFWQPETVYQPGDVVKSDSMPNGTEAVMVATKAGSTSNVEPQWGAVGGANISDGACFWKLRWRHWSKDVEQITDLTTGATNRLPNTSYAVGNVVYDRSNLSVALKCTQAGTTSNTELDISTKAVGESVEDGGVVWKVIARSNVLDNANADTAKKALEFLGGLPLAGGAMTGVIDFVTEQGLSLKTFKSPAELGLTGTNIDLVQIYNAMPDGSMFIGAANYANLAAAQSDETGETNTPYYNGVCLIVRFNDGRSLVFNPYSTIGSRNNQFAFTHFYRSDGSNVVDKIAPWGFVGKRPTILQNNNGYVSFENTLIFAWARVPSEKNPQVVTKPIPFTTYVAIPGDSDSNGSRQYQAWDQSKTTNTTDTFNRDSAGDAMVVFWVGKAV